MTYDFQMLEKLVQNFKRGQELTSIQQDVLMAIHSIGRDGISVNGNILYNLTSTEYEKIVEELNSISLLNYEDRCNILKEKLLIYANSIDYIISEIMKDSLTLEYREQLFENLEFAKYLSEGLAILKDFK